MYLTIAFLSWDELAPASDNPEHKISSALVGAWQGGGMTVLDGQPRPLRRGNSCPHRCFLASENSNMAEGSRFFTDITVHSDLP